MIETALAPYKVGINGITIPILIPLLRCFFAARCAAGGKAKYEDQGKTEAQGPFGERFHVKFLLQKVAQALKRRAGKKKAAPRPDFRTRSALLRYHPN